MLNKGALEEVLTTAVHIVKCIPPRPLKLSVGKQDMEFVTEMRRKEINSCREYL